MSPFIPHARRVWPLLALLDAAALALANWLAHLVRFSGPIRQEKLDLVLSSPVFVAAAFSLMWALAAAIELYQPLVLRRRRETATRVWLVALGWGAGLALATYLVPPWQFGRGLLLLTTVGWGLLAVAVRTAVSGWLSSRPRPVALVMGEAGAVSAACDRLRAHPLCPWELQDGSGVAPEDAGAAVGRVGAEFVILAGAEPSVGSLASDLATLHFSGVPVLVASEAWAWIDGRLPLAELSPSSFLHQPGFGAVHWELFNRITRVADVVVAAALLVLSAPLLAVAALAVLVADGRPVFFLQRRVGQFGRGFRVIKLRTMRRDAEAHGPVFAEEEDPRATPLGRVLRRLRIDELPQLVNVIRGDMSLVGPRPERPEFVAELIREIPFYTFRLAVPPGLTGWAQVNMAYARSLDEHRRKLEYDLFFIRERSFGMYVVTLLRTLSAALLGTRGQGGGV
jgi:lipopolysaccharide/colanic/teichoic acid biosynthesis glycosyltransferase